MSYIHCLFWGIFFEDYDLDSTLEQDISNKHITFGFKSVFPVELSGHEIDVEIIGYGNDGINEGYLVKIPNWCYEYYDGAEQPHITTSVSLNGKPKDTGFLEFELIEPFTITGKFGYMTFDQEVVT